MVAKVLAAPPKSWSPSVKAIKAVRDSFMSIWPLDPNALTRPKHTDGAHNHLLTPCVLGLANHSGIGTAHHVI